MVTPAVVNVPAARGRGVAGQKMVMMWNRVTQKRCNLIIQKRRCNAAKSTQRLARPNQEDDAILGPLADGWFPRRDQPRAPRGVQQQQ
jgi:hypothetical protein